MLILYHNRYIFSVYDDVESYLDEFERAQQYSKTEYWYLSGRKRKQIKVQKSRNKYLARKNRSIYENLLSRKDYSTPEAKQDTIVAIYQWLNMLPFDFDHENQIDIKTWKQDLEDQFVYVLKSEVNEDTTELPVMPVRKKIPDHFHEILTGSDMGEKKQKFERLAQALIIHQWISETENPGIYRYRKTTKGGRLYLGALYFSLNKQGHIKKELDGAEIAELLNSWLSHDFTFDSLTKAFQPAEQDRFNGAENSSHYRYVEASEMVLRDLLKN